MSEALVTIQEPIVKEGVVVDRAVFVKNRILQISKTAGDLILEAAVLLREYKDQAYFKEDGYQTFDDAIEAFHARGLVDYGSRQARYLITTVDAVERLGISSETVETLGISKLREIASLGKAPEAQKKLLNAAKDMSVAEVQKEAKKLRDQAAGRESDPFDPIIVRNSTASQKQFYEECIRVARVEYSHKEQVPEAAVLESILADWRSGVSVEAANAA